MNLTYPIESLFRDASVAAIDVRIYFTGELNKSHPGRAPTRSQSPPTAPFPQLVLSPPIQPGCKPLGNLSSSTYE